MAKSKTVDVAAAAAALTAIPEGKIVDFISGNLLTDTPEEYVRQNVAMSLVLEYGYDRSQIEVEFKVKVGSSRKRVDLAIFPPDTQHVQENISVIIETKKEGTKREDKNDGEGQLKSYMAACLNAEYGMWTNGEDRVCYQRGTDKGTHIFIESIDIPAQGRKKAEAPTRDVLRPATGDNLLFAFRRCHNYIAGNQGLQKPEAFWELLKLIFCKIEDERSEDDTLQFYVTQTERSSMTQQAKVKVRLQKLFTEKVVKEYPTIFKPNDQLEMKPAVLTYVVSELQQYALLDSPVDVKGVAYEAVVESNLRGARGEFFTPRNACRMAVKMLNPQPGERILDPACGTGGFLTIAMNHVLDIIHENHRKRWRNGKPTETQTLEYHRARSQFLVNNIFGLDLNPNLVRATKMNMVMNNDGSGSLYQCDSLEHPHRWPEEAAKAVPLGSIDVLFANPPFGTKIVRDEPRILQQYDVAAQWTDKDDEGKPVPLCMRRMADGKPILQSSQPPELLFVERAIQFLKPGGRMAIVLPNGLLNNTGLAYFRKVILEKAQLLAVVDMHRDLFQPNNDTQTSMVLLRKWGEGQNAEKQGDYPIFMAIADAVGHNKRGAVVYKREADGSLILEEKAIRQTRTSRTGEIQEVVVKSKQPIVDDELDEVADSYLEWLDRMSSSAGRRSMRGGV
nr:N-6 DNA methylase [Myxococcus sp. MH1]